MLRDSGRKLFLATNSQWDYTNVVMNYLLSDKASDADAFEALHVLLAVTLVQVFPRVGHCMSTRPICRCSECNRIAKAA